MKVSVDWLKEFVKMSPPVARVADRLTLAGLEVKKCEQIQSPQDTVFEIEITSNRADWLSHWGIAREIAAVENLSLKSPELDQEKNKQPAKGWTVSIKDIIACPYYSGALIEGIMETKTPEFIVNRLAACGIRSINLAVDITNYVLMETGQPLHAFDADLLNGTEIFVRKAKAGEKFLAINGATLSLKPDDLVIADKDRAIALAGVMGGKETEIANRTRNVFLESAFFNPTRVRKSVRAHQLSSDSSYRFERRVDPEGVDVGLHRAIYLFQKYAKPRTISAVVKAGDLPLQEVKSVQLKSSDVKNILGVELKPNQIVSILARLGLDAKLFSEGIWKVAIPSFRPDLTRPVDLVEEIARIYGYENIPETLPSQIPLAVGESPRLKLERKLRNFLAGSGLSETVTFSLISDTGLNAEKDLSNAVRITNPLHHETHWMRPTFATSLLTVIQKNINAGAKSVPIFEIANAYSIPDIHKHPLEERVLAIALYGKRTEGTWLDASRDVSFYDLKGIVEAVFRTAGIAETCTAELKKSFLIAETAKEIRIWQTPIAFWGEITSEVRQKWGIKEPVFYAEIKLDELLKKSREVREFKEWTKYPSIERDFSLVVPDTVKGGSLIAEIQALGGGLIREVVLFDLFRGKRVPQGYKNLAFRVVYQSAERTLVSYEIQVLHEKIADTLIKKYQAAFQV